MTLQLGALVWVDLGQRQPPGHEQEGRRPCVVVGLPSQVQTLRYPLLIVAPLTTAVLSAQPLYPRLQAGMSGLPADSTVLLDQLVAIDATRVQRLIGTLNAQNYQPIQQGLRLMFGL